MNHSPPCKALKTLRYDYWVGKHKGVGGLYVVPLEPWGCEPGNVREKWNIHKKKLDNPTNGEGKNPDPEILLKQEKGSG